MCAANKSVAEREQWKIDFREVHDKQQKQLRAIQQDADSGIQNRAIVDNALGNMIHPPGSNSGRSNSGRSMQIEAIHARVVSQSGHTIARERRESEIIPQVMPVARGPAVIPAVINPDAIVNVQQRRPALNQIEDDPLIAAILRSNFSSAPAANTHLVNTKGQLENRSIELQILMQQHKFAADLPATYPNKEAILKTLTDKIIDNHSAIDNLTHNCPICLEDFTGVAHNTARLPCCSQFIHTHCLAKLIAEGVSTHSRKCPYCRGNLYEN